MSFAGGGWVLAGSAMRARGKSKLITVGRVLIAIAALFFGVEHFLHPAGCPGVPLEKLMPSWIPGRLLIGYLTGATLLVAGATILLAKKTRMAATYLGTWIVLLVLFIYGPILIAQMSAPSTAAKVEGINYFADTLLFAGAILALASATHGLNGGGCVAQTFNANATESCATPPTSWSVSCASSRSREGKGRSTSGKGVLSPPPVL